MNSLLIIPEKLYFGPKNFKTILLPWKSLASILSLYATVTLCKKSEKFHAMTFDTWETLFRTHFRSVCPKNLKIRFSSRKIFSKNRVTSSKNIEKFHVLIFRKLEKPHFGFCRPKNPRTCILSKNRLHLFLRWMALFLLKVCKKPENSYEQFWKKTPNVQTNKCTKDIS